MKTMKNVRARFIASLQPRLIAMLMAAAMVGGCAQNTPTPPHAASKKTWKFGGLTWSDAIRIPECNKETFESSTVTPQCRSYTKGSNTWYYYNWPYVNTHASTLCPDPWRVPTEDDFEALTAAASSAELAAAWGYGGEVDGSSLSSVSSEGWFWSSDKRSRSYYAPALYYDVILGIAGVRAMDRGVQVRCVK